MLYSSSHTLTLFSGDIAACENCVVGVVDCTYFHVALVLSSFHVSCDVLFPLVAAGNIFSVKIVMDACELPFASATQGHFIRSALNLKILSYIF